MEIHSPVIRGMPGRTARVIGSGTTQANNIQINKADTGNAVRATAASAQAASSTPLTDTLSLSGKAVFRQQVDVAWAMQSGGGRRTEAAASDDSEDYRLGEADDDHDEDFESPHEEDAAQMMSGFAMRITQRFVRADGSSTGQATLPAAGDAPMQRASVTADAAAVAAKASPAMPVDSATAAAASRSLSSSLRLTTVEGDVVTVKVSRSQSVNVAALDNGSGRGVAVGAQSSAQLAISIQGDLNEEESEAIGEVIEKVGKLVQNLYTGNVGAALGRLSRLEVDVERLAAVTLNMSSRFGLAAVNRYSEVGRLSGGQADTVAAPAPAVVNAASASEPAVAVTDPPPDSAPARVVTAVQQSRELIGQSAASGTFTDPFAEIRKLFTAIADGVAALNDAVSAQQNAFIKQLFNHVVDRLEHNGDLPTLRAVREGGHGADTESLHAA